MAHTPAKYPTKAMLGETRPSWTMALICVAGMNHSPPTATIRSPAMMPPLYPSFVASHPAGTDMRK